MNGQPPAKLRESEYTGLTHDGGRTSLPWAVWIEGRIVLWEDNVKRAWVRLREEVRERGVQVETERGSFLFVE